MKAIVKCKVLVEIEKIVDLSESEYELMSSCNGHDIAPKFRKEFELLNDKVIIDSKVDGPEEFQKISVSKYEM